MEGSKASFERTFEGRASEDKKQGSSVNLSSSGSDDSRRTCLARSVTSKVRLLVYVYCFVSRHISIQIQVGLVYFLIGCSDRIYQSGNGGSQKGK